PAANDTRWSNVMYIGSSPRCPRNDAYNASMRRWFEAGDSPDDFGEGHYEREWHGRASVNELNAVGRQQLGYDPVPAA
ncbi:MAG: YbiU family protein, partial [Synechococcaceae cyanobacterium]|nr:YbiU family protein [Synechococcaceae cyanobacterium]